MNRFKHRLLLLSLKASTVEACFSVPMLNLTLPNFPFVIAFAVTSLGWGPVAVGLMAALPHLCNMAQPLMITALRRRLSLYHILVLTFIFSALPWGFVSLLPFLSRFARDTSFAAILTVATLANSLSAVSWSAAIAELVPPRLAGRFFGRRNLVFGFWTLLTVFVVSTLAESGKDDASLILFGGIFAAAGLARLIGLFFLTRMTFPLSVTQRSSVPPNFSEIKAPLSDIHFLRFVGFIGLWGFMLNLGQPFYTVFLVQILQRPLGNIGLLTGLAGIGGLLTVKGWGWLSDRFGSKPVLHVCAVLWSLAGLTAWAFAGERLFWHLAAGYLITGAATAGFQLCQFQLMLKLSPTNKAPSVAVFLALSSLMTALGPILGSVFLNLTPDRLGIFFGQTLRDYHVLILGSMVGCLASIRLLGRVQEMEAKEPEAVWDSMRRGSAINPAVILATTAQMILTPRGLFNLSSTSFRAVRRQVRILGDVGGEIVDGTSEILRAKLGRNDKEL